MCVLIWHYRPFDKIEFLICLCALNEASTIPVVQLPVLTGNESSEIRNSRNPYPKLNTWNVCPENDPNLHDSTRSYAKLKSRPLHIWVLIRKNEECVRIAEFLFRLECRRRCWVNLSRSLDEPGRCCETEVTATRITLYFTVIFEYC